MRPVPLRKDPVKSRDPLRQAPWKGHPSAQWKCIHRAPPQPGKGWGVGLPIGSSPNCIPAGRKELASPLSHGGCICKSQSHRRAVLSTA